jgi:O-antigen/teichoic acid export membrane protein
VAVAANDIVATLLGPRWASAAPLLRILAFAVGPMFVTQIVGTTFDSLGLLAKKLGVQLAMLTTLAIAMFLLQNQGMRGIATAVVTAEATRAIVYTVLLQNQFKYPIKDWWVCIGVAGANFAAVAAATALASAVLPVEWPSWFRMTIDLAAASVGIGLAFILLRPLLRNMKAIKTLQSMSQFATRLFRTTQS